MTEQELITLLTKGVPRKDEGLKVGIGDDCAVIEGDGFDWLVTTDALFEGIHFNFEYTDDYSLGRKSLSVNLSDIAAMGGVPLFYTVSLGVPSPFPPPQNGRIFPKSRHSCESRNPVRLNSLDPRFRGDDKLEQPLRKQHREGEGETKRVLKSLYKGMNDVAKSAGVVLIGGDTCASRSGLVISITVIGHVEKGKAVLRSGAKPGDGIYVTGTFGDSALGLACLKRGCGEKVFRCVIATPSLSRGKQSHEIPPHPPLKKGGRGDLDTRNDFFHFIDRYNNPSARLKLGRQLAESGVVTSMIDVSDGLVADLGHIAEMSNVGFEIDATKVPMTKGFSGIAKEMGLNPLEFAMTGGEDYELAFTVAKNTPHPHPLPQGEREKGEGVITRIGKITSNPKDRIILGADGKRMSFKRAGYNHFGDF